MNIEKNIPISGKGGKAIGKTDLLRQMEIGDSIAGTEREVETLRQLSARAGIKVTTRRENSGGARLWRVA